MVWRPRGIQYVGLVLILAGLALWAVRLFGLGGGDVCRPVRLWEFAPLL
jgi:hypothetical protein